MNIALAPSNPMNRAMASCLVCEVVVFGLAFPGMVMVSHQPVWLAATGCLLAVALCIMGAARLRTPAGYVMGWLAQFVGIALGFLTPMMFGVGLMFLVIWGTSFVMGRRLEAQDA